MPFIEIQSCKECGHKRVERTIRAGCASDWLCDLIPVAKDNLHPYGLKQIAGYIEWPSEEPKEIPNWCPIRQDKDEILQKKINSKPISKKVKIETEIEEFYCPICNSFLCNSNSKISDDITCKKCNYRMP